MSDEVRVVIDTNVFVSSLASPKSMPKQAIDVAFEVATLLVSDATLTELVDVLHRPKFIRYFRLPDARNIIDRLANEAVFVPVAHSAKRSRDPKDDAFLDLAIAGRADLLVTGDNDLLVLAEVGVTRIVTPAAFVDEMRRIGKRLNPRT